jgi:hypothetical protein
LNFTAIKITSNRANNAPKAKIVDTFPNLSINAPITGPIINHNQKIAPINQKFFAFVSLSGEISVRIACNIDTLPHVIPFIILDSKNIRYCFVINKTRYERNVPKTHRTRDFFLPILSEICPSNGADKNANNEYIVNHNVT